MRTSNTRNVSNILEMRTCFLIYESLHFGGAANFSPAVKMFLNLFTFQKCVKVSFVQLQSNFVICEQRISQLGLNPWCYEKRHALLRVTLCVVLYYHATVGYTHMSLSFYIKLKYLLQSIIQQ